MSHQSNSESAIPAEQDVCPCKHMEGMVSRFADGSLHGPARWYTQVHAMHCKQCSAAIKNLRVVIDRVGDLRDDAASGAARLPADRRADLERAMDEVDAAAPGKG